MITLAQPSMALNDPRVDCKYNMWNTWNIRTTETKSHIVDWVAEVARKAPGGKLNNLVINCHGRPGHIGLGEGFGISDTPLFRKWRGLIDKIWISACRVAYIESSLSDGNMFCSAFAKEAGAYLVVGTQTQYSVGSYSYGKIDTFEGLVLSYSPAGSVTWSERYNSLPLHL